MDKKTTLGLAATSLTAAATLLAPSTASAQDIIFCDPKTCPVPDIDPFHKVENVFYKINETLPEVFHKLEIVLDALFIKFD